MPEPQWHLLAAPAVYAVTKHASRHVEPLTATAASVLVDADHFCDMLYYRQTGDRHRQFVPLHSWELVGMLLLSRSKRLRSIGVGFLIHHLLDRTVGDYKVKNLSLTYRLIKRFRTGYLGDWVLWPNGSRGWRELFYSDTVK